MLEDESCHDLWGSGGSFGGILVQREGRQRNIKTVHDADDSAELLRDLLVPTDVRSSGSGLCSRSSSVAEQQGWIRSAPRSFRL